MKTELGINHNGIWTAHQYVIDAGYDWDCVVQTADLGISMAEMEDGGLTDEQQSKVISHCKSRVAERAKSND